MRYFSYSATAQEIKEQYRLLAKQHHPDLPGGSNETMQEINAEYKRALDRKKNILQGANSFNITTDDVEDAIESILSDRKIVSILAAGMLAYSLTILIRNFRRR